MKDTISYDLVHHQQQQQQQQQQHHHQQQQHQQQHQQHQHQQHHHHLAQLGQYSHQQLQSVSHHNNQPASSAYYQQAHLYPAFQDQQQAGGNEHHHHHHHAGGQAVTSASNASTVLNAAVAAAGQHQQHPHQQQQQQHHSNTQVSALHHSGWSTGVGGLAAQSHHAVVTDHSPLAYMPHAYQSHTSNVTEHSRNAAGQLANQPIGTGPQASSYTLDSLYNSPAAAAAVAAYGYNNYNTAFFQTSNNGPHTQTGHPNQAANLSAFWNHHQGSQQRTGQSQSVEQTSLQQRQQQQIATDQSTSYMHDPRLYYVRPSYDQVMQNFAPTQTQSPTQAQAQIQPNQQQQQTQLQQQQPQQHQPQHQHQHQQQHQPQPPPADTAAHNRVPALSQQPTSLLNHQELDSQRFDSHNQSHQLPQHTSSTSSSLAGQTATVTSSQVSQQNSIENAIPSHQHATVTQNQQGIKMQASKISPKYPVQKQSSSNEVPTPSLAKSQKEPHGQQVVNNNNKNTPAPIVKPPPVVHDDRHKLDMLDRNQNHRDTRAPPAESKNQATMANDLVQSVEDSFASLALSSRKTTWASIAGQPAKVSAPKSLKSKISGNSNSALSSAKHLTSSVTLDSSLDSKNSINPAIKISVSTAVTSTQRGSIPPPITKANPAAPSLNLDLLGDGLGSSKISWPAVNASVNLTLDDPPLKKEASNVNTRQSDRFARDEEPRKQDARDMPYRDHNNKQGPGARMVNNYSNPPGHREDGREDPRDDHWGNRRGPRDHRVRRDSDRREPPKPEERVRNDDQRNQMNSRRDHRSGGRANNFRGDESPFRDSNNKRGGPMMDRQDQRGNNNNNINNSNNYRFPPPNRHDQPRDQNQGNQNRSNESAPHHHYNNLRDGNSVRDNQGKLDLDLHPHLNPANYNPKSFDCEPENAKYFIIKSYSEDDIHRSIKYSIWCSTNRGNKRLDEAYRQQQAKNGPLYLFFSVNASGHFCGMAEMTSAVDFDSSSGVWAQSKWQGEFSVRWIYVKDVPNTALRHITLENNEGKPVTNSRDTQEVPSEHGKSVLSIIHKYNHTTSLFDDFLHYERRQEEERMKKSHSEHQQHQHPQQQQQQQQHHSGRSDERINGGGGGGGYRYNRPYNNSRGAGFGEFRDNSGSRDRPSRFES